MDQMDYLTFAVTKSCNFKCPYCSSNGAGEAQFSRVAHINPNLVDLVTKVATSNGVRRIRLSGGEPFMHKKIGDIVRNIAKHNPDEIVLDTNASAIKDQNAILSSPPPQLKIVCSIDSLNEKGHDFHAGVSGLREASIENIKMVAQLGLLKRLNMVVTKKNIDEVKEMAEFCRSLGVPLKLSDVGIRRNQIGVFEDIYVSLHDIKEKLKDTRVRVEFDYSQNFGTPCDTFDVDGQAIKIKDSSKGAKYNFSEACGKCEFYPCSEGLYMITVMPDGTFSGCQSNGYNIKLLPAELGQACMVAPQQPIIQKITSIIKEMSNVIQSATHAETSLSKNLQMKGMENA